jgi:mono/diheme cytochrome c family protein
MRTVWRWLSILIVVTVIVFGAFFAWAWHSEIPPTVSTTTFDPGLIAKGAQLAAIGDCAVCHTEAGGRPYAGGYPIQTPFGTFYGSNITPDADTGIGRWSEAAFRRALREGVDRNGVHLYPTFPYDHFTQTTDSDIAALYAFLMTREPVHQPSRVSELVFPLNFRIFAAGWKLLFLDKGEMARNASQSAEWNRGAYLAESLGHCGACHTPRNILGAEKRDEYYAGGEGEGWQAPALDESSPAPVPWTADQLHAYLRTGFADQHGHVAGPMQPVVHNLTKVPDGDVRAIATYIASLAGPRNEAAQEHETQAALAFAQERATKVPMPLRGDGQATTGTGAGAERVVLASNKSQPPGGATTFAGACANCHHSGGDLPISRPIELGLSTPVNAPDPTNLIRIVLGGVHPAPGERGPIMPGFSGALTDPQIVALVSYVRSQFSREPAWPNVVSVLSEIRKGNKPAAGSP